MHLNLEKSKKNVKNDEQMAKIKNGQGEGLKLKIEQNQSHILIQHEFILQISPVNIIFMGKGTTCPRSNPIGKHMRTLLERASNTAVTHRDSERQYCQLSSVKLARKRLCIHKRQNWCHPLLVQFPHMCLLHRLLYRQ